MTWCIAADSSCNIRTFTPESEATYRLAPLKINVGGTEYTDDEHLDIRALLDAMALEDQASSSACPSVGEWAEIFRTADNIIAICISSNVSGSYDAACTARNLVMEEYMRENGGIITGKNIQVVDARAAFRFAFWVRQAPRAPSRSSVPRAARKRCSRRSWTSWRPTVTAAAWSTSTM